jgi:hypothetical protein
MRDEWKVFRKPGCLINGHGAWAASIAVFVEIYDVGQSHKYINVA